MDSKIKVIQVFNKNPQGSGLRRQPKKRWWTYVPKDINKCKLKTGKRSQKPELNGRSPLRRRRSELDCSTT
jgi:hypothetical protein